MTLFKKDSQIKTWETRSEGLQFTHTDDAGVERSVTIYYCINGDAINTDRSLALEITHPDKSASSIETLFYEDILTDAMFSDDLSERAAWYVHFSNFIAWQGIITPELDALIDLMINRHVAELKKDQQVL